ncbi:Tetracycline resistance protein, TetA/multidrug resistance protein MdtG [Penicillium expansum]|uniref:Tetracycline resistance protein, TetA/multidrug resistance protein MdtG n=1 Tax=Penicillium expansum TaxID=27334 RepID=A0A0A2JSA7_PENEN|nr:Tetracycline resistance protein, TetA/multidrug resistance protein MdtG [Penicillium expansum]KGO55105.1 Tetracycline resistance protein, TetA/multidrug resistance protein MdtG [Penicillium expansum]KGO66783.1 Tetracycline resistance protein, TetA/multidrug resistance protein MdtG [Penicillium expansum]
MGDLQEKPLGYKWRSSKWFIISTITLALFGETFLYAFIVPILDYMLQTRLHIDRSKTQKVTSIVLGLHGAISVIAGPIIGHFADKTPSRKTPLLLSLITCIIGTVMMASTHSIPILFLGRALQAVASSAVWIIGYATIADTANQGNLGTTMGIAMSFVHLGVVGGPAISGVLLEVAGYWITWMVPLLILVIDLVARLLMIESPSTSFSQSDIKSSKIGDTVDSTETTGLLPPQGDPQYPPTTASGFWRIILCDARVLTVLLIQVLNIAVAACFNATIPLHVQKTFGWGPSKIGFLFSCLVLPTLLIGPLAGWIRDRVGIRYPAAISLVLQAAVLVLLGIAGNEQISWASAQKYGGTLYIASIMAMGALRPFIAGLGPVELTAAVKSHQERRPGIFGPEGGLSRVFAIMEVAASVGMTIGPIVGGSLKESFGYDYMSWTWRSGDPEMLSAGDSADGEC